MVTAKEKFRTLTVLLLFGVVSWIVLAMVSVPATVSGADRH